MTKTITNIPFNGFYNSLETDALDHVLETYIGSVDGEPNHDLLHGCNNMDTNINDCIYWEGVHEEFLKDVYIPFVKKHIKDEYSLDINLTFEKLTSPREYNFETDRLFVEIETDDVATLFDNIDKNAFKKAVERTFESRSGFIPFYSDDVSEWLTKDVTEWDHNEIGLIFEVALDGDFNDEWINHLNEQSETLHNIINNNISSDKAVEWNRLNSIICYLNDRAERENKIRLAKIFETI